MNNTKKVLIGILLLLIIIAIVILCREYVLWNTGKLDTSNKMNRDEMITLLDKGATYPNYSYSSDVRSGEIKTKTVVKDNKVFTYIGSNLIKSEDYNTGDTTNYWDKDGEKIEGEYNNPEISRYNQHNYDYSLIADYEHFGNYDYEYLGEKEDNGKTVILFQMNAPKEDAFNSAGARFVVDKETGLILRRIEFSKYLFITTYQNNCNRNVSFDEISDSEL